MFVRIPTEILFFSSFFQCHVSPTVVSVVIDIVSLVWLVRLPKTREWAHVTGDRRLHMTLEHVDRELPIIQTWSQLPTKFKLGGIRRAILHSVWLITPIVLQYKSRTLESYHGVVVPWRPCWYLQTWFGHQNQACQFLDIFKGGVLSWTTVRSSLQYPKLICTENPVNLMNDEEIEQRRKW